MRRLRITVAHSFIGAWIAARVVIARSRVRYPRPARANNCDWSRDSRWRQWRYVVCCLRLLKLIMHSARGHGSCGVLELLVNTSCWLILDEGCWRLQSSCRAWGSARLGSGPQTPPRGAQPSATQRRPNLDYPIRTRAEPSRAGRPSVCLSVYPGCGCSWDSRLAPCSLVYLSSAARGARLPPRCPLLRPTNLTFCTGALLIGGEVSGAAASLRRRGL